MKTPAKIFTALICIAAFSTPCLSEEKPPFAPPQQPAHPGMAGPGMAHPGMAAPGMTAPGAGQAPGGGGMGMMGGISEAQIDAHLRQMQEKMLRDYDFMRKIRESKDEKEQTKLKDEWLQAMKQHVKNQIPTQLRTHGTPEKPAEK